MLSRDSSCQSSGTYRIYCETSRQTCILSRQSCRRFSKSCISLRIICRTSRKSCRDFSKSCRRFRRSCRTSRQSCGRFSKSRISFRICYGDLPSGVVFSFTDKGGLLFSCLIQRLCFNPILKSIYSSIDE